MTAGTQRSGLAIGVVVLVAAAALLAWHGESSSAPPRHSPEASASGASHGLRSDQVALAALPAQARATVALVERGGPYPYDQDGAPFGDPQGLLPPQPTGYYRAYAVPGPGTGPGPGRIVLGAGGELYYSPDRGRSFRVVVGAASG